MKRKLTKILSVMLILTFALVGCGTKDKIEESNDDKLTIVTSFYPIYVSTVNVVRDIPGVEVINMTKAQTGCLHDYSLTPEDSKILEKADILVVNGAGMESFLEKAISSNKDMKVIEASEGIELLSSDEEHNHENEEHDHEHEVENGHVWVSVSNAITQVENIANKLAELDSENAPAYEKNAKEYVSNLITLRADIHASLDSIPNKDIVTFHESFSYFAKEFGLNVVDVIETEPGVEPSPKQLEETIESVKEHNVKALFTEPQYASKSAGTISRETGAKVYEIDPIVTGESTKGAENDYINKMRENLKVIEEALK